MHYKVIFHINEPDKWDTVLANVSNLYADLTEDEIDAIVLVNGAAVAYYAADSKAEIGKMQELTKKGTHFVACNNALKGNKLKKEDLYDFVEVVPAGVSELVKRQHEGYAYIKP